MCRAFRRVSDSVQNRVPSQRRANLAPIVDPILAPPRKGIKRSWTTLVRDAKVTSVDQTDARYARLKGSVWVGRLRLERSQMPAGQARPESGRSGGNCTRSAFDESCFSQIVCENCPTGMSEECRNDATLRQFVASWHRLTPDVRAAIMQLVRGRG
jgi:hypothetical protein